MKIPPGALGKVDERVAGMVVDDEAELFAAPPAWHGMRTAQGAHDVSHDGQDLVASVMPMLIVQCLEMVDIEQDDRQRPDGSGRGQHRIDVGAQSAPVQQPGQRVVTSQGLQLTDEAEHDEQEQQPVSDQGIGHHACPEHDIGQGELGRGIGDGSGTANDEQSLGQRGDGLDQDGDGSGLVNAA